MHRRRFLRHSVYASAMMTIAGRLPILAESQQKHILVLGGTYFLGPAIVNAALARGHKVTLFNRGITNPQVFPLLPKLRGLRSLDLKQQNLAPLAHTHWDAVIDVWPSQPSLASTAAEFLRDKTEHYLYVSSIAAYNLSNYAHAGTTENAKLRSYDGDENQYGPGKAESERRLEAIVGKRLTIVRPGPIEPGTDCIGGGMLLTWLARAQAGGRHIGPGDGSDPMQFVDVKDVAKFLVQAIDKSVYGTFNLVEQSRTFREHIECCKAATHSNAEFVWIPRDFLEANGLPPASANSNGKPDYFGGWRPDASRKGLFQMSNVKAVATGWQPRPFNDSAQDRLGFCSVRPNGTFDFADSLTAEKEAAVLDAWDRRMKVTTAHGK